MPRLAVIVKPFLSFQISETGEFRCQLAAALQLMAGEHLVAYGHLQKINKNFCHIKATESVVRDSFFG